MYMLVVAIELWPNILHEERASKLVKGHAQQQQKLQTLFSLWKCQPNSRRYATRYSP